jgi:hypothetical protein
LANEGSGGGDGGGWNQHVSELPLPPAPTQDSGSAIDSVHASHIDAERFASDYFGRRPLVIRGGIRPGSDWPLAFRKWRRDAMLQEFGGREILVRTRASSCLTDNTACIADDGRATMQLRQYIEQLHTFAAEARAGRTVPYTHDRHFAKQALPEIREHFVTPRLLCASTDLPCEPLPPSSSPAHAHHNAGAAASNYTEDTLYFIGAPGSGVGFHRHGHAWNVVVFGRKRWLLYPPSFLSHSTVSLQNSSLDGVGWLREYYATVVGTPLAPLECTIGPGDILYIPAHWNHATINVQTTIGVAMNYADRRSQIVKRPAREFQWTSAPASAVEEGISALADAEAAACGGAMPADGQAEQSSGSSSSAAPAGGAGRMAGPAAGRMAGRWPPASASSSVACAEARLELAVAEVSKYVYNGVDTLGVRRSHSLGTGEAAASAVRGLARLSVLIDQQWPILCSRGAAEEEEEKEAQTDGDATGRTGTHKLNHMNTMSRVVQRARFVRGLVYATAATANPGKLSAHAAADEAGMRTLLYPQVRLPAYDRPAAHGDRIQYNVQRACVHVSYELVATDRQRRACACCCCMVLLCCVAYAARGQCACGGAARAHGGCATATEDQRPQRTEHSHQQLPRRYSRGGW